jgi:hypothetical protein
MTKFSEIYVAVFYANFVNKLEKSTISPITFRSIQILLIFFHQLQNLKRGERIVQSVVMFAIRWLPEFQ